ncbi:histidine--tRNA ligase [Paenibacillus hunanensis]|uniref:Histidine--tRNA ligase n=1 Tax=Paenibacillus hunanensis TaxID=539262 RepID=A0ABU1IXP3_9BACL|nr:histidine--tRNA ligase [Paenibacillus hunanensis]MDR6243996.1 histidyl-tRNA synthetase [Paenibacillus hunanensis]GGJ15428.1 histidine--tRNA ligase 1 [Paenibacillus hunanensis]
MQTVQMQNVKGTSDYISGEQRLRRQIRNLLEQQFYCFGYEEAETSALSELEWLTSKYGGGEEITKEIYRLSDQRGRELGLRYDLTMPLARLLTLNPGLRLPYRRFEMGKVFRDGPTKRGRLREFWQCDADVVGVAGPEAELELFQLAIQSFDKLDIPVIIRWNNRSLLAEVLMALEVPESLLSSVMLTLDKLAKISRADVAAELSSKGLNASATKQLMELINRDPQQLTLNALAATYTLDDQPGYREAQTLQQLLNSLEIDNVCVFDLFLSRGLSFYTGTVYEIFDATGQYTSSLGSGGRYDGMIGKLSDRSELELPAVGLSFGLESVMELYRQQTQAQAVLRNPIDIDVAVIPIGNTLVEAVRTSGLLRNAGITTITDTSGRKLGKLLNSLYTRGIRFVILIGEDEVRAEKVKLRDLAEGVEIAVPVEEALYRLTQICL